MTKILWGAAATVLAIALIPAAVWSAEGYGGGSAPPASVPQGQSQSRGPSTPVRVRPEIAKPLIEAGKLNEAKDFAGAMAKVREADAVGDKTPVEEYHISKTIGQIALNLNDHPTALQAFNRAVASGGMPPEDKPIILYIAMVLNAEAKNYAQAVANGEMLLAAGPLEEKAAVALAQSYYNKGDHPNAMKIVQETLARNPSPQNKALLLEVQTRVQARRGDTGAVVASLEAQCAEQCDGKSWGNLVGVTFSKIGSRLTDHQALNLFRLKLVAGGMEAADYATMAGIALDAGLPAEAQSVLQKGIAAGVVSRSGRAAEILNRASGRVAADARSLPQFEREASAKANGEEDVKLGESYYSHGQLAQAETALRRGLGKSGVRDRADAQITLGVILLAAGKKDEALAAFKAAESGAQAPVAHIWTLYANRKG